jgi:hypothetical protein
MILSAFGARGRGPARASELAGAVMNLFLGAVCLLLGFNRALVFIGTGSSLPFGILGGALVLLGAARLWRWNVRRLKAKAEENAERAAPDDPNVAP